MGEIEGLHDCWGEGIIHSTANFGTRSSPEILGPTLSLELVKAGGGALKD